METNGNQNLTPAGRRSPGGFPPGDIWKMEATG